MLNHFRTLLINESFFEEGEHIPRTFRTKPLPQDLKKIYDRIFAPACSRYYKLFLAHSFLNIIKSVDLEDYVTSFDSRISYTLENQDFFKINRHSNPVLSNKAFPINILTPLTNIQFNDYFYDSFKVQQVNDKIKVISKLKNKSLVGKEEFDVDDSDGEFLISFPGGAKTSSIVHIGQTGVSFTISNLSNEDFITTPDKTWEFFIEAPYTFDFLSLMHSMESIEVFKTLNKYSTELEFFEEQWNKNFNLLTRFSYLLIAFVTVLNSL